MQISERQCKSSLPSDGQAIAANISRQGGGGGGGCHPLPPFEILTIACLTFCLLLTGLPEYKLKVVNICEMDGTGGLEVVVL